MSEQRQKSEKKHDLHILVDEQTFLDAKEAGINISRACERMLKDMTAKMIVPNQKTQLKEIDPPDS
jgi:post-segregation antitoxin (ccd killing protein)